MSLEGRKQSNEAKIRPGFVDPGNDNIEDGKQHNSRALLVDKIVATLKRFLVLPTHAAETMALWVLFTHTLQVWEHSPRLILTSPGPGSGKSRTLAILSRLCAGGNKVDHATEAYITRYVDEQKGKPFTLLLDEADSFFGDKPQLKPVLNAGWEHGGKAGRAKYNSKKQYVSEHLSLWAAIAIAGIGKKWTWPPLLDRSLVFELKKKLPHEVVEEWGKHHFEEVDELGRQAAQWARTNLAELDKAQTVMPTELQNRHRDNWRPLITIADRVGGPWPQRARQIALELSGATTKISDGRLLLSKIREVFDERSVDRIRSQDLLEALQKRGLLKLPHPNALAAVLKGFDIAPRQMKFEGIGAKGYRRPDFEDAWSRYVDG